jgi:hypothetical protein
MTQETQTQQVEQQPISVNLNLTLEQINFVMGALGKLPTETGAWIVLQVIRSQAQTQIESLHPQEEITEETPAIQ